MYVDLDFESIKPFDDLLGRHSVILGREPNAHAHIISDTDMLLCNALMASVPGHPLWKETFQELRVRSKINDPPNATGPHLLLQAFLNYQSKVSFVRSDPIYVAEPDLLYPLFGNPSHMRTICNVKAYWVSERRKITCSLLNATDYANPGAKPTSLAVHHWSSVWRSGIGKSHPFVSIAAFVPSRMFWSEAGDQQSLPDSNLLEPKSGSKIPAIIHQIWRDKNLPKSVSEYIQSWIRNNRSWSYRLWTLSDVRNLISTDYSELLGYFDRCEERKRLIIAKYLILWHHGGLYCDLDLESLHSFHQFIRDKQLILAEDAAMHTKLFEDKEIKISPSIVASVPRHDFIWAMLEQLNLRGDSDESAVMTILYEAHLKSVNKAQTSPIYLASHDVFSPAFDPRYDAEEKCKSHKYFSLRQISLCDKLRLSEFNSVEITPNSLAVSHWLHLSENMQMALHETVDISVITNSVRYPGKLSSDPIASENTADEATLPHVIHQVLFESGNVDLNSEWTQSWIANHPSWAYKLWREAECRDLVLYYYPHLVTAYDAYQASSYRAELVKYLILNLYGGVFVDLNVKSIRPLDEIMAKSTFIVGYLPFEYTTIVLNASIPLVSTSIIAAIPGHPLLQTIIEVAYNRSEYARSVEIAVGSIMLTEAIMAYTTLAAHLDIYVAQFDALYSFQGFMPVLQAFCDNSQLSASARLTCDSLPEQRSSRESLAIYYASKNVAAKSPSSITIPDVLQWSPPSKQESHTLIPKIIHQVWLAEDNGQKKFPIIPLKFDPHVHSLVRQHKRWKYKLWAAADARKLVSDHYPEYLDMYDGYAENIHRADAIRYFILNLYGGSAIIFTRHIF